MSVAAMVMTREYIESMTRSGACPLPVVGIWVALLPLFTGAHQAVAQLAEIMLTQVCRRQRSAIPFPISESIGLFRQSASMIDKVVQYISLSGTRTRLVHH